MNIFTNYECLSRYSVKWYRKGWEKEYKLMGGNQLEVIRPKLTFLRQSFERISSQDFVWDSDLLVAGPGADEPGLAHRVVPHEDTLDQLSPRPLVLHHWCQDAMRKLVTEKIIHCANFFSVKEYLWLIGHFASIKKGKSSIILKSFCALAAVNWYNW